MRAFFAEALELGGYELVPAIIAGPGRAPEILDEPKLTKRHIHLKDFSDITGRDLEQIAFPELAAEFRLRSA